MWVISGGSSPRGRGKPQLTIKDSQLWRLIPAWAGKTNQVIGRYGTVWAHPRVGGENKRLTEGDYEGYGSSPRGRGKRGQSGRRRGPTGLIPAWAGKTELHCGLHVFHGAHPRVGGENALRDLSEDDSSWLIPAWAGKTAQGVNQIHEVLAHPRVGGENGGGATGNSSLVGSSPRGRGKPRSRPGPSG